jgi:hypothetical protein
MKDQIAFNSLDLVDTIERTADLAIFICLPPGPGLLRAMASHVTLLSTIAHERRKPPKHEFTESNGNAWVLVELTELFIRRPDSAKWPQARAWTFKNARVQGLND